MFGILILALDNPERQEFFGTVINSSHQLENAVDLGFSVKDYFGDRERAALYQVIWEASSNVTATFKQLEEGGVGITSGTNNKLGEDIDPANGS